VTLDTGVYPATILVVDDEEANVDLLQQMLARAGYTHVIGTTDARQALPLVLSHDPDLILLDLLMPHLDGFAVLEQLRAHLPAGEYRPVLVLTADITREAKQRALAGGASDFLTKPFDQIELLLRIANLLETRRLHQQLRRQNRLLEQLYDEAREALRARDVTLSTITHDLGQPLSSVKIRTQALRRRAAGGPGADARWLVDELASIDAATVKMLSMIGELLDLARLEAGRPLDLNWQPTDLVALVRAGVESYQQTTDRHRIVLETDADELIGEWDGPRLERVLDNLLSNAVKYSPDGGTITVRVRRELGEHGPYALLEVEDHGIGIPAADLPHVFDRFHRAANAAGRFSGAGIGLAGAKQIVDQHGGSIGVVSTEGDGACFSVRLPLDC
jgi:signal transduction histidine kinase